MIENVIRGRKVYVYRGVCDMRRSFDRLAQMVDEQMEQDALSGDVYLFLNRDLSRLKMLYWDHDGYVIWNKRLEQGEFKMPGGKSIKIDQTTMINMLEGVEVKVLRREKRYGR